MTKAQGWGQNHIPAVSSGSSETTIDIREMLENKLEFFDICVEEFTGNSDLSAQAASCALSEFSTNDGTFAAEELWQRERKSWLLRGAQLEMSFLPWRQPHRGNCAPHFWIMSQGPNPYLWPVESVRNHILSGTLTVCSESSRNRIRGNLLFGLVFELQNKRCSEITPGSLLRNYFWWCSRD